MNLKKIDFDQIQSYIKKYNDVVDLAAHLNTKPDLLIDAIVKIGITVLDKSKEKFINDFIKDQNPETMKFLENLTLFLKSNEVEK